MIEVGGIVVETGETADTDCPVRGSYVEYKSQ